MQERAWLIYLDITRYNILGYFKQQLNKSDDIKFLFGIDEEILSEVEPSQDIYFYLTNTQKRDCTGNYYFLKKFLCQGEIVEITEERPDDGKFWTYEEDAEKDAQFEKYAKIKITKDLLEKNITSKAISWQGCRKSRRMTLLSEADTKELRDAAKK